VLNPAQRPTCSNCGALKPWLCNQCGQRNHADRRSCSQCGALRPQPRKILEMDGAPMKELVVDQYAYITRMSYRQLLRARRTEEELQAYARSHGYKPGWVWWKMKEQEETFAPQQERRA
jgi:predicted amidophosphoribosyltransferase